MKITNYDQASNLWLDYQQGLRGYVLKKVKNSDVTNEIMQEVLLKIYNSCCSNQDIKKLNSWLFQVANNTVIDYWRKQRRFNEKLPELIQEEENTVWRELSEYIGPLVKLLPVKYAEPLYLSDIEGLKQTIIAEQLNLGLSATKSRIQRGREMLQKQIKSCFTVETDSSGHLLDFKMKSTCSSLKKNS